MFKHTLGAIKKILTVTIALVLMLSVTPVMAAEVSIGPDEPSGVAGPEQQSAEYGVGRETIRTTCGSTIVLAVTNLVPTTIKNPSNAGECAFTLQCQRGISDIGFTGHLSPGHVLHSFSCGTATQLFLSTEGTEGQAIITFVP
jgi:hypothetical protein